MAAPLLGLLLRGAMGTASGTARLAAMTGRAGRSAIGAAARFRPPVSGPGKRHDTPEMQVLRRRIASPLSTREQVQGDRSRLAGMLITQRKKRIKDFSDPTRLRKFGEGIERSTFSLGKFGLKTIGLVSGVAGATSGLSRLANASNDQAISSLRMLSPAMAAIAMQRDAFGMRQGALTGESTAGSAKKAEEARQRAEKAGKPFGIFWKNFKNDSSAKYSGTKADLLEALNDSGLTEFATGANADRLQGQTTARGSVLTGLDSILQKGIHNDPNLMNRRPNEKPGGRM